MQITIQLHIDDDVANVLESEKREKPASFWFALGLYLSGKISLAKAAKIANLDRFSFEKYLSELDLPISLLSETDIEEELNLLDSVS